MAAIGTEAESRLVGAECESGEGSTAEGATKLEGATTLDGAIAGEPSSGPPISPLPQDWQLV